MYKFDLPVGTKFAGCSACGHTFATPNLFDKHRTGYGNHGGCKEPAKVRINGKRVFRLESGVWKSAESRPEKISS